MTKKQEAINKFRYAQRIFTRLVPGYRHTVILDETSLSGAKALQHSVPVETHRAIANLCWQNKTFEHARALRQKHIMVAQLKNLVVTCVEEETQRETPFQAGDKLTNQRTGLGYFVVDACLRGADPVMQVFRPILAGMTPLEEKEPEPPLTVGPEVIFAWAEFVTEHKSFPHHLVIAEDKHKAWVKTRDYSIIGPYAFETHIMPKGQKTLFFNLEGEI